MIQTLKIEVASHRIRHRVMGRGLWQELIAKTGEGRRSMHIKPVYTAITCSCGLGLEAHSSAKVFLLLVQARERSQSWLLWGVCKDKSCGDGQIS
jgi:hypothetical protein